MARKPSKNQKELVGEEVLDKGIYKFLTPEEVDNMIKGHMDAVRKTHQCKWQKDELLIRNAVILEYICTQGLSNRQTALQISDRWQISEHTAIEWVKSALQTLGEHVTDNIEDQRNKHLERLESILQDALDRSASDTALKAMDQIAKVLGLNSEKREVNVNETINFEFQ